jgi:hypothetical protein
MYIRMLSPDNYMRKRVESRVHQCGWLAKGLGVIMCIVVSEKNQEDTRTFYLRWPMHLPFGLGSVITGWLTFRKSCPSIPKLILSRQNLIPRNSKIISACVRGDIVELRKVLEAREAHPNDCTTDSITVFRVSIEMLVFFILYSHG